MNYTVIVSDLAQKILDGYVHNGVCKQKRIDELLDGLAENPRKCKGKPEPLVGNLKGYWSVRITGKYRMIYSINDTTIEVLIVYADNHYGDK